MPEATVRAEAVIEAPRETVWAVLADLPRYPEWNPFTVRVRSTLRVGDPVDMRVMLHGVPHPQREWIRSVSHCEHICWGMHMLSPKLLRAERWQTLETLGPDRTRYVSEDRLEGPLVPLVLRTYGGAMQRGFDALATALKHRAESMYDRRRRSQPVPA
ncbi:MAG: SRPBCC domain-containing protein [Polyangiales bacterium]